MIIANNVGAAGNIATVPVSLAPTDGYTLLFSTATIAVGVIALSTGPEDNQELPRMNLARKV